MITITAIARLGRNPETRDVGGGGRTVTKCSVASTTKRGQDEHTTWLNLSIWGKQGETFATFFAKGDLVFITGTLMERAYTSAGEDRKSLDVDVSGWSFAQSKADRQASRPAEDSIPF
jgi:single stranded DNA-binding protein|tara:strand:+ start:550 stop:903 length:354 start_codon:yes stop_codon:yes gene_type:complete